MMGFIAELTNDELIGFARNAVVTRVHWVLLVERSVHKKETFIGYGIYRFASSVARV